MMELSFLSISLLDDFQSIICIFPCVQVHVGTCTLPYLSRTPKGTFGSCVCHRVAAGTLIPCKLSVMLLPLNKVKPFRTFVSRWLPISFADRGAHFQEPVCPSRIIEYKLKPAACMLCSIVSRLEAFSLRVAL